MSPALLFLDIDGTLIPFGSAEPYPVHSSSFAPDANAHPLLSRLDPALGAAVRALSVDLVWATTWPAADANDIVGRWLGWPPLPAVSWPEDTDAPNRVHWKLPALLTYAAGRPFIWVDDEISASDQEWVAAMHGGTALLQGVDHRRGLGSAGIAVIRQWLDSRAGDAERARRL